MVAREIEDAGGQAVGVSCDVSDEVQVQAAFAAASNAFQRIDILVNNAGFVESAPLVRLDAALWNKTIAINLTGTYQCTRAVLPGMIERRSGRVINIASTAGRIGYQYTAAYCAAKHGVLGLTRAVALEVAAKGITVNAVCPGWVDTEMTAASIRRMVERTGLEYAIAIVAAVIHEHAVDQTGESGGSGEACVPIPPCRSPWLMTLHAVGGEVRTNPVFETHGSVGRIGECREGVPIRYVRRKVAGIT